MSDKYVKLRAAAAVIFLIIGAAAIAYGVSQLFAVDKGWQRIEITPTAVSCSGDFTLLYDIGAGELSARDENRQLEALWTDITESAAKIFDPATEYKGVGNLAALNNHPNEAVELEPALYSALELMESYGDRTAYLGPAFGIYNNVFDCTEDWQLEDFDPVSGEPIRELFGKIAAFAADPDSVRVELLGQNMARLCVSEEYLEFLEFEELDGTVDFYWMKNAFITDYLADRLTDEGFTRAVITSFDGFIRNIDQRNTGFGLDVLDIKGGELTGAANMSYRGAMTIIAYRSFPVLQSDSRRFYVTQDGQTRTMYLSFPDAMPGTPADSLTVYSKVLGCAELMLETAPIFTGETISAGALAGLTDCHAVWPENGVVYYTDPEAQILAGETYELELVK